MFKKSNKISIWHYTNHVVIAVLILMLSSVAIGLDETTTLEKGEWYYVKLTGIGGYTIIDVNINVVNGGPIDVYLMDSLEYAHFSQGKEFEYYIAGYAKGVKSKKYSFVVPKTGDYYLVIDNTNTGTTPSGSVDVHIIAESKEITPEKKDQGIFDSANRLFDDYKWKLDLVTEIQRRTDALGTSATKEMYIEWKRRNNEAIEAGERLATYLSENRAILDKGTVENWASNTLVFVAQNKVTLERDNQNLEQIINSLDVSQRTAVIPKETNTQETPGFEAILAIFVIVALVFWRR